SGVCHRGRIVVEAQDRVIIDDGTMQHGLSFEMVSMIRRADGRQADLHGRRRIIARLDAACERASDYLDPNDLALGRTFRSSIYTRPERDEVDLRTSFRSAVWRHAYGEIRAAIGALAVAFALGDPDCPGFGFIEARA